MNIKQLDKKYVWHPYTQMLDWQRSDIKVIQRAKNSWLFDSDGRKYLDGVASMWCNVWGHTKKEIVCAMIEQIRNLQHSTLFGLANEPSILLAKLLMKYAKGMSRVFYSDNGSTAVEVAIKMALQYWRNTGKRNKNRFVALDRGYHGDTIGAMSVGYIEHFFANYKKVLFNVKRVQSPYLYRRCKNMSEDEFIAYCVNSVEKILRSDDSVGALIMESGTQVAGGAIIYPNGYQKQVKDLCKKYDVLFILDEVATGFGRLGAMIEYLAQDSKPDIVAFGKMLTAGYLPLAATLATEKIYDSFLGDPNEYKHLFHGHTFTGNPIACATAIANLQLYEKKNLIDDVKKKSTLIKRRLHEINSFEVVGDVRHKGMLVGIELVKDKKSKKPFTIKGKKINHLIMQESLKRGVFLRPLGHIMLLVPPLATPDKELNMLIDVAIEIIKNMQRTSN
ncbi:MAG: adenosylmethionine--8-amino-7-oxononanoate transaminase [Nitrososphaerales archaeon]